MKEQFIDKKFQPESLRLLETISTIVQRYQAKGLDLTVRQLFYQCVVINLVPNNQQSYNRTQALIGDARLAGLRFTLRFPCSPSGLNHVIS